MRDRIIQLQESAEELGFGTIQQALDAGYHEVQDLVNNTFKLEKVEDLTNKAYRELHETWESERDEVLDGLDIVAHSDSVPFEHKEIVKEAIDFIRKWGR